jgi:hypothetical protein
MALQFRRGEDADRTSVTPLAGEPLWITDTDELYIGDGSTAGGVLITGGGGGGAPTNADYLVKTANGTLTAERVVTDSTSVTANWATGGQVAFERAALTGDVTASANGNTTTIANDAVTFAKMQNIATDKLLGRATPSSGDVEEITCTSAGRALLDDADAAAQRTTLGLGTIATQAASSVTITGGSLEGVTVTTGTYSSNVNEAIMHAVRKASAGTLSKGDVIRITGSSGTHLQVELADASVEATSAGTIGIAATTITNSTTGYMMVAGELTGLSNVPTASFTDGAALWLSETTGAFTTTRPTQPNHGVFLGWVVAASNGSAGRVYVKVINYSELNELHDVLINTGTLADNHFLVYESATSLWKNESPSDARTSLGLGTVATESTVPINKGGTGQTAATAAFDALAPTTTKGDIIVYDGTDNIRLAVGGTNNHVLTVDSSTATGLKWAAASGGSGSVATDTIWDAAGDLAVGSTADTAVRLARGTAGQVLTVNSGATNIEWARPAGFNPATTCETWSDFLSSSTVPWGNSTANGGTNAFTQPGTGNARFGLVNLGTGTTSASARTFVGSTNQDAMEFGGGAHVFETAGTLINNLSSSTERFIVYAGFFDLLTDTPAEGAYFRYSDNVNGGDWECVTVSGSTETLTDSNVAVTVSTFNKLRIEVNGAGTEAKFYIDGSLVATHTTNMPGSGDRFGVGFNVRKTVGTSLRQSRWDYLYHKAEVTR